MTPEHEARRKEILAKLARRKRGSAGLVAYADGEPVGYISLGPRSDYPNVERSRGTPVVDDVPVWVIPVHHGPQGTPRQRRAIAMIRAAVAYAAESLSPASRASIRHASTMRTTPAPQKRRLARRA